LSLVESDIDGCVATFRFQSLFDVCRSLLMYVCRFRFGVYRGFFDSFVACRIRHR